MRTELLILCAAAIPAVAHGQQPASVPPPAVVAQGKTIFEGKAGGAICFTCHALNAKGVTGLGPNLTDRTWLHGDGSLTFIEQIIKTGVPKPKQSGAVMPPMGGASLTPEQVKAVAAYVYSLSRAAK